MIQGRINKGVRQRQYSSVQVVLGRASVIGGQRISLFLIPNFWLRWQRQIRFIPEIGDIWRMFFHLLEDNLNRFI